MEVWAGFVMGVIGSMHCVGMCGPIAFALPYDRTRWFPAFLNNYVYQMGRVLTYGLLGLAIGFVGRGFSLSGIQQPLSIGVGLIMMFLVLFPRIKFLNRFSGSITMKVSKLKSSMGLYMKKRGLSALFITGLLNGLLPCGLVYMALLGALGMSSPVNASLFMVLFGLGTFPLMFAMGYLGNIIQPNFKAKIQKAIPVLVFCMGVLFVLRGMGLGIKYVSPSTNVLSIEQTEVCH
jgi:sulfite exporter TauE/SafE